MKAKECVDRVSAEEFAIVLAKHFTSFYHQASLLNYRQCELLVFSRNVYLFDMDL